MPDALERIPAEVERERQESKRRSTERASTREELLGRIRSFDPMTFARESAQGLFAGLGDRFQRLQGRRNVGLNRRGIFGSPIGAQDIQRDFNEQLAQGISERALQAAGLTGQNIDRLAGVSRADREDFRSTRDRELDLLTAQAEHELRERERKAAEGGGFWDTFGDIVGLVPGVGDALETGIDIFRRF